MTAPAVGQHKQIKGYADIPGWFWWLDRHLFATVLDLQKDSAAGTLVELGTYLGKSAVIIGDFIRPGERFVALDLFGRSDLLDDSAQAAANKAETERSYTSLSRQEFERNYLSLHDTLPDIVEGPSAEIVAHVEPASARFIHVDASHLYAHVAVDAQNVKTLLRPGGIVVFDDWRSEHTPGVSAAVWQAVFADGLIPIAVTANKFYGVYSDPEIYLETLRELAEADNRIWSEEQEINGRPLIRLGLTNQKPARVTAKAELSERDIDKLADRIATKLAPTLALTPRLP